MNVQTSMSSAVPLTLTALSQEKELEEMGMQIMLILSFGKFIVAVWSNHHHCGLNDDTTVSLRVSSCGYSRLEH
jgi:hypothetical protein